MPVPKLLSSPVHLQTDSLHRLRLLLCSEELAVRYGGVVWLTGSALTDSDPADWDVRVVIDDKTFDARERIYWSTESALRTREQRKWNHLNFDIRIYPGRLWYEGSALRLARFEPGLVSQPFDSTETPEGIEQAKKTIAQHKDNPEFHMLIGSLMFMRGDKKTALQAFTRSVQLNPELAGGWLNIGNVYYDFKEFRKAAIYYRRAIVLKPDYAKAYTNLANTLVQLGVHASAVPLYDKAIQLEPDLAPSHHNRANCLTYLKQFDAAELSLNRALEIEPGDERVLNTLGNLRSTQGLEYGSAAAYRLAILMAPRYAPLYTNLANIYMNFGWSKEAILNYERGLVLEPKNPGVRYNLALAYLRAGNYRLGWRAYESRFGFNELSVKPRAFSQPLWKGDPIRKKRILLHAEQGLGDTFQFSRYVPLVAEWFGAICYLEVQHGLQRIMASVWGVTKICTRGMALPEFDVHCPLMSLPAVFGTTLNTVPVRIPYLSAWNWEVSEARLRWPQPGFRVGINWAGNPKYKKDKVRSFSLSEFAPLADLAVTFFSLQKGPATRQIEKYRDIIDVVDASSDAKDFAETAALISTMDLIITSDSSPAHLAAAMDKEVWLLLSYLPDWRWMESGESTPWYPNMRLFRQTAAGDWFGVMVRVREELRKRLEGSCS